MLHPMTLDELIQAFGGTAATAKKFGVVPSAVSNWKSAGQFPERMHFRVFQEAQALGISLPADFFQAESNARDEKRFRDDHGDVTA